MAGVISSVSSSPAERDAWKRAAELAGMAWPVWCREALNAAAEATIAEAEAPPAKPRVRVPAGRAAIEETADPNAAYVPPELPPLPPGAKTAPVDPDDLDRFRQRGLVASFIRADGREWRGNGPDPLRAGCSIRKDVLAEFADRLDMLRDYVAAKAEETAMMRAAGVPA
jgi:hypothetical protein